MPGYDEMIRLADEGLASANVLFREPEEQEGMRFIAFPGSAWVRRYYRTLLAVRRDLETLAREPETARRYSVLVEPDRSDSIDELNMLVLASAGRSLAENFENALFGALAARGFTRATLADLTSPEAVDGRFLLRHGIRAEKALGLFRSYLTELRRLAGSGSQELSRLRPDFDRAAGGGGLFSGDEVGVASVGGRPMAEIGALLDRYDRFGGHAAFRYLDGEYLPVDTGDIRQVGDFFGYAGVKRALGEHFGRFAAGERVEPLLISSLPGLGKTQFTMAFTLERPELKLILAGPEALERELEKLLADLGRAKHQRFVVFFDDIDPARLDWYLFRTNIGGSLSTPENVMVALAANYEFPASILSRGRGVNFPAFDETRCEEMVADFLVSKGIRNPTPELVSVIAADYSEEFGQKKFPELSPRTLMRYLGWYATDARKRQRLLEQSKMELIVRPDAQLFYEFNLKQLKLLYGEEKVLDAVREKLTS